MKIWRIEHDCPTAHGPIATPGDVKCWREKPNYGFNLEAPQQDPLFEGIFVTSNIFFGTLEHQFPRWWLDGAPDYLSDGWVAVLMEIPDQDVFVGTNQVMFYRESALTLLKTTTDFPR